MCTCTRACTRLHAPVRAGLWPGSISSRRLRA
jgi:hypothetical protein